MPAMNGLAAAQALKRLMPAVPLILYGSAEKIVRQRTRALGVAALIPKADPQNKVPNIARTLLAPRDTAAGKPTSFDSEQRSLAYQSQIAADQLGLRALPSHCEGRHSANL